MECFTFWNKPTYPREVREVMRKSGDNRMEMEKAMDHYSSAKDSLKLKAFWFLLESMPVGSISLQLKSIPKGTENIYLCVFDNSDWRPVAVSEILDGTITFMDMGMDIVYLPMRYQNEKFIPVHEPVVLDSWGNSNKLDIETGKFNLVLKRKFFKKTIFKQISGIKGKFQGANKSDFSDAIDLYTITDSLDLVNHFEPLDDTTSFRYFRYLFSGELNGQLAEFRVMYQDRNRLEGEIIKDSRLIGNETINSAFDADVLSFANRH